MFSGLDSIEWGAMRHAYGPAADVPDLLRGLVSDNPATREVALDGMYGAVHHQGDVYECTVAAIPFLQEAAAAPALPGRGGVLELLASIAGVGWGTLDGSEDLVSDKPLYVAARQAVASACPLYLDLLTDPDPEVRRAAPKALRACHDDAPRVVSALRERLGEEPDAETRAAVIAAAGALGRRAAVGQSTDTDPGGVGTWLADLAGQADADPQTRLAAVAELARYAPGLLSPDAEAIAADLLRMVYAAGSPAQPPAGFSTSTLIGALREISEQDAAGRRAPEAAELVHSVSVAFGDRVEDRVQILTRLLREPGWEARHDALRPAKVLIERWRGSYEELAFLMGKQLLDPEPRLAAVAADALADLGELAAPAADVLARALSTAPREASHTRRGLPAWITPYERGLPSTGPILKALAALHDPRALPAVQWALERPSMPGDIGHVAAQFESAAAGLVPLICRRLEDLPFVDGHDRRRTGLVLALSRIGEAAVAAVPQLLTLPPDTSVLIALGRIGPGAAEAVPVLRQLLGRGEPAIEIAAATALWRVTADPRAVLPVLTRHLDSGGRSVTGAAEALAELGPAAANTAPRLRELLGATPPGNTWPRLRAAGALRRAAGEVSSTLPVLLEAWSENPHTRVDVAGYLAEMGPAAITAAPLLRAEMERRRRHRASEYTWSSSDLPADLALLRACDLALAALAS